MYPKCYIAEGCEGDEGCKALCPAGRTVKPRRVATGPLVWRGGKPATYSFWIHR